MLEDARKKGASIFVYLIFCLLIVIFVINFGPQGGQESGCRGTQNVAISVDGKTATQASYHVAFSNPYNRATGKQHTYVALETIIRRELLAQEAERRGMRVTDDMVMEEIKKGYFFLGGQRAQIPGIFSEVAGADGKTERFWNNNAFRGWVGQLNVSKNSYIAEQQRGLLAALMQQVLVDSVVVSRDEALAHFLFENNTVQYDVVAFRPEPYRAAMKLTDADVERFVSTHGAEVQARYDADKRTYTGVKPQLQLRQIFIAKLEEPKKDEPPAPAPAPAQGSAAGSAAPAAPAAGSAAPAAGSAAGSAAPPAPKKDAPKKDEAKKDAPKKDVAKKDVAKKEAPKKPVGMKIEDAKAKLDAVRTAAEKDKQKFIDAAKTLNTDDAMKASAGDLGWRSVETPALGEKAVSDAIKTLEPGKLTPVITTDKGAYLILAEAKREGDLKFEQVKHEIAKELARDVWSKEAAKRAALSALDKARTGVGLNLDQMYEKEQAPASPGIDIEQILNDPNMTEEQKKRLLEMIMKQGQQSGSLVIESKDIPAAWKADQPDGAGGSATRKMPPPAAGSAAPAAGSAAPATKPAGPPTPQPKPPAGTKPAAGSAATPPAGAGSGTKPAAGSAATPAGAGSATKPAAGSSATPAGAGSATKPAAGSAAPAAGSAAPAAGSGAGAGSALPPAGTPAPATPPASTEVVASTDKLPDFGDIAKATVARFGPAPRTTTMSGIGSSKEAATALFDELTPGMLAKKVYEGDGAFVVVQLISKSDPKAEEFEKDADRMIEELRAERAQAFVDDWLKERCEKLLKDEKIKPNAGLIRETDEQGKPLPTQYRPCMSFR